MEKRLKLAKTLLKESGTIFISIDDNEVAQIKLLCDEIFGETNLVANIIWKRRANPPNDQIIGTTHEYILCYAKNAKTAKLYRRERTQENIDRYKNPDGHPKGPWVAGDLMANVKGGRYVESLRFPIISPLTGEEFYPSSNGNWRFNRDKIKMLMKNNEIYFGKDGKGRPKLKRFLADVREGVPLASIWDDVGFNTTATGELMRLFGTVNIFDTPKPLPLITEILKLTTGLAGEELILDFFAGSGTTGEAVLELNDLDKGKRKFILCTDNQNNICTEVCYSRLRKVITGYQNPNNEIIQGIQGNLKYFKTDFVDAEPTDLNKKKLVDKSTEMLCLKEDCFNEVKNEENFKIFGNEDGKSLGIIYDDKGIEPFKQEVRKSNKKFIVYVFSLDESAREEEFEDIQDSVSLKPIPAVILNVYKRIFK